MSQRATSTRMGFTTEDITFHGGRRQDEIIKELGLEPSNLSEDNVEAPKSLTSEQLIDFYKECIKNTKDLDRNKVYTKTIHIIEENEVMKNKLRTYVLKELEAQRSEETVDDIQK